MAKGSHTQCLGDGLLRWQDAGGTRWILAAAGSAVVAWKVVDHNGGPSLQPGRVWREVISPLTPTIVNGVVFAVSGGESPQAVLYALDGAAGHAVWNSGNAMGSFVHGGGLSGGSGQLYLGTHDGTLYAFGFRSSTKMPSRIVRLTAVMFLSAAGLWAQLPDGPGKAETARVCKGCHELERSLSPRQDREAWQQTLDKMVSLGLEMTEQDYNTILDYLAKNYPGEEMAKLNINQATQIEFESRLTLPRSQAAAIIEYRAKHGPFKAIDDLKKVPGVDAARIDAKKDRLTL